jgi:GT2 family glycosyltransferase
MKRVLEDYPMASSDGPGPQLASDPAVSFVITHRGQERLPLLLATVNSIAAQSEGVECVVVEQSVVPECSEHLPSWVRYVHAPPDDPAAPFGKSKAYNVGVAHARAPVLVLHDGDVLVPMHYAREVRAKVADGFEAVDLKRYVFYLSEAHTARLLRGESTALDEPPEKVVQNLGAATTIAVTRAAFEAIGGFDEEFLGWGGEDLEFWERARTRKPYDYTYLPFIHLWHAPQPEKNPDKKTPGMRLYSRLSALPIEERIRALKQRGRI